MTSRCHSVFSLRSPVALSFQDSEVASRRLAIGRPSWVRRISGSAPRLPTKITLLTLPAISLSLRRHCPLHHPPHLVPDAGFALARRPIRRRCPHDVAIMFLVCSRPECKGIAPPPRRSPHPI